MYSCRIYLFTYKRNELLPRAVQSLLNQTFTDWICEVHNDDPADDFPAQYICNLNDPRFALKNHSQNLGAVRSFNLAFAGCDEQFASMLEDDNWWEPEFLNTAISFLNHNPEVNMVWSNMRLWQEYPGNNWSDTGKTTWSYGQDQLFNWWQQRQIIGHMHSNGAMVYRPAELAGSLIPDNTLFNAIEAIRERSFKHPIALLASPLANFAITLSTNRSASATEWIATQVMLLASFVNTAPDKKQAFAATLAHHRKLTPSPIANFYLANKWVIKDYSLNQLFTVKDRLFLMKWIIKNSFIISKIKRYIDDHQAVYQYLIEHTKNRFTETTNHKY